MKKLTLMILLAAAVASNAAAWIEHPVEGANREFTDAGDRPDGQSEPLIENSLPGEYRESTSAGSNLDAWIDGMLWVLRV